VSEAGERALWTEVNKTEVHYYRVLFRYISDHSEGRGGDPRGTCSVFTPAAISSGDQGDVDRGGVEASNGANLPCQGLLYVYNSQSTIYAIVAIVAIPRHSKPLRIVTLRAGASRDTYGSSVHFGHHWGC
jgi:hypothetical protein